MTRDYLEKNWIVSSYNKDTPEQLDYYINPNCCSVEDIAYVYEHEHNNLEKFKIVHIVRRSDDVKLYNTLISNDNVLLDGEDTFGADTSAEFITNDDCYLVWFQLDEWQWPLKNYFAGYEVNLLKEGDAVMLVEKDCAPRNVIILEKTETYLAVGENDLVFFASYGTSWKICPPSAGALDYPLKNAAWAEAVFRITDEFHLDAEDHPELTHEIFRNLDENDYFIDSEIASQVTTETAKDYVERHWDSLSEGQKEIWKDFFSDLETN